MKIDLEKFICSLLEEYNFYPEPSEEFKSLINALKQQGLTYKNGKIVEIEPKKERAEEDNEHLERILKELKNQWQRPYNRPYLDEIVSDYYWLKSLKDRVLPQPKQEWSEEDKYNLSDVEAMIHTMKGDGLNADRLINWLKSLRPQSHWKPSDEQMIAIDTAINVLGKGTLSGKQLIELQEDLKKLK